MKIVILIACGIAALMLTGVLGPPDTVVPSSQTESVVAPTESVCEARPVPDTAVAALPAVASEALPVKAGKESAPPDSLRNQDRAASVVQLQGTIERVGEDSLTLREDDSQAAVRVSVPETATIFRNRRITTLDQLVPDDLAQIEAERTPQGPVASVIQATSLQ